MIDNDNKLIERAKEIIADGFGCDHFCERMGSDCGCKEDARKILELVRNYLLTGKIP